MSSEKAPGAAPARILVVQIGRIGDTVLTTPLFRALSEALPGAEIHTIASRHGAPVLLGNPRLKKIFVYRKEPLSLLFLFGRLLANHYDWLIDPKDHASTESAVIAGFCRADKKAGINKAGSVVFTHSIPTNEENFNSSAAERSLLCLRPLGIPVPADFRPELFPDKTLQERIRATFLQDDKKTVLINISAGGATRYWTATGWAETARFCMAKGLNALLVHMPQDAPLMRRILPLCPGLRVFRSSSIRDVIALMLLVSLVVSPDTSIVHIASAFDTPQVTLFPDVEWNVKKFRPLSGNSVVILPEKGKQVSSIPAARVIGEVEKMLSIINAK